MNSFYICIAKYPKLGFGAFDPDTFDGAVDNFADFRDEPSHRYWPAWVYRCDPQAGTMEDVTADAIKAIERRLSQCGYNYPEWLLDEVA